MVFHNDQTGDDHHYIKLNAHASSRRECLDKAPKIIKKIDSRSPMVALPFGVWTKVCADPKAYSTHDYKVIDGKLNLDAERVDAERDTLERYERILEANYEREEHTNQKDMRQRASRLVNKEDVERGHDLRAYTRRLVMLDETRRHLRHKQAELRLLAEREQILISLLSLDDAEFSDKWMFEYEQVLKQTGQTPGVLDVAFTKAEVVEVERDGLLDAFAKCNHAFNELKFN